MIPVITCEPGTSPGWTLALMTIPFLSWENIAGFFWFLNKFSSFICSYLFNLPLVEVITKN